VLTEALLTGRFDSSAAAGSVGSEKRKKLIDELSALLGRKKLLRPEMLKAQQARDLQREIDSRTAELRNLEAERLRGSSLTPALTPPRLSLEQIKALLDRDTILLEFSLGDESSYLWLVKGEPAQAVLTVPLPDRRQVEKVARRVHELLSDKNISPQGAAELQTLSAQLSDMLLGKVSQELGAKRLVIVGDGSLQYLPFGALPEPGLPDRQPLIVRHEIVYIPSASTLAILRTPTPTRTPATQSAALFGDPVYELPGGQKPLEQPSQKAERRLVPLAFSRDEIKAIEDAFAKSQSAKGIKSWTDYDATRQNALSPDLLKYKIIHYSAHGVADDQRPEASGLYFSRYDRNGNEIPYFVSLRDIYDMKLASDLVVLSACSTALGKEVRGEGLVGLTRGFMHAGSPRIVSTFWRVDQFYTSELMKSFYNNMLTGKQPPAAALRATQRKMWEQDLLPYLWAGFVLYGDWR
jgi:CHAT domain-containing protein